MAAPHRDTDDMITELMKDHREVEELFGRLTQVRPAEDRQEIVQEVITELVRHSIAEEQHLYPTAREVLPDGDSLADREIADHAEVELLMKRLENLAPTDADFEPTLRELMTSVRQHLEEEERELFPRLRQACSVERLHELGDKLRRAKSMAPTHPHPNAPTTPPANKFAAPLAGLVDRVRDSLTR